MAKYKVGDKVRVRSDLEMRKVYSMEDGESKNSVVKDMFELRGKIVTIKDFSLGQYFIEGCGYRWTDEMFEGLAEEREFHVYDTVKHPKYGIGTVIEYENEKDILVDYDEWHEGCWNGNKYFTPKMQLELVQAYVPN